MIVKLQRPLIGEGAALVYDEDRQHLKLIAMTPALAKMFGDAFVIYAEAEVIDGDMVIGKRAPDQDW